MNRSLLLPLLLLACNSGKIDAPAEATDTGEPDVEEDVDTGDTGEEPEPDPEPDFSVWEASRQFTIDAEWDDYDCEAEVTETGTELTSGSAYEELQAMCPSCSHFYEVSLSTDEICDYLPISQDPYRGITLGDDWAQVYRFGEDRRGDLEMDELDLGASFDGWTITYTTTSYEGWLGEISAVSTVTFPELAQ